MHSRTIALSNEWHIFWGDATAIILHHTRITQEIHLDPDEARACVKGILDQLRDGLSECENGKGCPKIVGHRGWKGKDGSGFLEHDTVV